MGAVAAARDRPAQTRRWIPATPNSAFDVFSAWMVVIQTINFANPADPIRSVTEIKCLGPQVMPECRKREPLTFLTNLASCPGHPTLPTSDGICSAGDCCLS